MNEAVTEIVAALDGDGGSLHLIETGMLRLRAAQGYSATFTETIRSLAGEQPLIAAVITHAKPLLIDDIRNEAALGSSIAAQEGIRACVCLPLLVGRTVVGTLSVTSRRAQRFQSTSPVLLEEIGRQVGLAVERARLLTEAEEQTAALRELSRRQTGLQDAAAQLVGKVGSDGVLDHILEYAIDLIGADNGVLFTCNWETREFEILKAIGSLAAKTGLRVAMEKSLAARIVAQGKKEIFTAEEIRSEGIPELLTQDWSSLLLTPLRVDTSDLGVLGIARGVGKAPFSEGDAGLLETFAHYAAMALHSTRLLRDSEVSRAYLEQLVDTAGDAIVTVDRQFRVSSWNKEAEQIFGYTAAEMVGQSIRKIWPGDSDEPRQVGLRVFAGETLRNLEFVRRDKEGRPCYLLATLSPICDSPGHVVGALGVYKDISEHRRMQMQLARQNSELQALHKIDQAILEIQEPHEVFQRIADHALALLEGRGCTLRVLSSDGDHLVRAAAAGESERSKSHSIPLAGSMSEHLMRTRQGLSLTWEELTRRFPASQRLRIEQPRNILIAPLLVKEECLGVIRVERDADQPMFTEAELFLLELLATQAAVAFRNARQHAQLEAAEAKYRDLFDHAPDMLHSVDEQGTILMCNATFARNLGYSKAELVGTCYFDLVLPSERDAARRVSEDLWRGGEPKMVERTWIRRDGSTFPVEATVRAERDAAGRVVVLHSDSRDISKRKEAEAALRRAHRELAEAEARYRELYDHAPDMYYSLDRQGRFLNCNHTYADALGYTKDEIMNSSYFDYLTEKERELARLNLHHIVSGGGQLQSERTLRRRDGGLIPIEFKVRAVRNGGGEVIRVDTILRDISDRKQMEKEKILLAKAVEQAGESIMITAPDSTIQYVNPAFERTTGYTRAEVIGKNARLLQSGKHDQAFYQTMWTKLRGDGVWAGRITNKKKNGQLYEEDITISLVRDENGATVNHVEVGRDITQELTLEAQLRQSQKMEAVGKLAGGIAHDFNNILMGIISHATLLKLAAHPGDEIAQTAELIIKAGERAALLTRQLLGIARGGKYQHVPIDIKGAIREVIELLGRTLDKNIQITQYYHQSGAYVHGDPGQLHQVILNLAINARDAMPDGGELRFDTHIVELDDLYRQTHALAKPGRYCMISVTDTGIGIPKELQNYIFEPFFTTKKPGEGTGLGLATVYGIVRNHGGLVQVYSEEGQGTTFKLYLPLAADLRGAESKQLLRAPQRGTGRILVVEDEEIVRIAVVKMLHCLGYEVDTVTDGEKAVEYFKTHAAKINLVLLDLIMPRMGGRDCFRALKKLDPNVKAVLTTGFGPSERTQAILGDGIFGFIQKPYQLEELAKVVAEALAGAGDIS